MVRERSDQTDLCDSCRFRHQESHIQSVPVKVGQELQGKRGVVPSIRFDYGIKDLPVLVPTGRSAELRDFRSRRRGRSGLSWLGPRWSASEELAMRISARRSCSVTSLRCPPGWSSDQPAAG